MKLTKKDKRTEIEKEIDNLARSLRFYNPSEDSYATVAANLETLCRAQERVRKPGVSPDAMVTAASSLAGILLILGYEHGHVITSKALAFVLKGRV